MAVNQPKGAATRSAQAVAQLHDGDEPASPVVIASKPRRRARVVVSADPCGQCGIGLAEMDWKVTREFGAICPSCAERYRSARRSQTNHRDVEGDKQARISSMLAEARDLLAQACWTAETIDCYALEGELLTVIAALDNVSGSHRRAGNERRFPADDHNG